MKKTIIHYTNDVDTILVHMMIGRLLKDDAIKILPEGKMFLIDEWNGYRIEGMHKKTAMTFHVTKLNT